MGSLRLLFLIYMYVHNKSLSVVQRAIQEQLSLSEKRLCHSGYGFYLYSTIQPIGN